MATLKENMRTDESIERAMASFKWDLDGLERALNHERFGSASTPKARSVAEYIDRRRRQGRTKAENDAHDLNLRMVRANEVSADAARRSATAAVVSAIFALFALLVAFAAYVHEAGKP